MQHKHLISLRDAVRLPLCSTSGDGAGHVRSFLSRSDGQAPVRAAHERAKDDDNASVVRCKRFLCFNTMPWHPTPSPAHL